MQTEVSLGAYKHERNEIDIRLLKSYAWIVLTAVLPSMH